MYVVVWFGELSGIDDETSVLTPTIYELMSNAPTGRNANDVSSMRPLEITRAHRTP